MRKKFCFAVGVASLALFAYAGTASADTTLGLTTKPAGSGEGGCSSAPAPTLVQIAQDTTTPYFAPGTGLITQWMTNVTGDTVGAPVTFAVLRPSGSNYTVVAADSETIPSSSGVATFTLPHPIFVQSGDTLGIYSSSAGVGCYWFGGSTPTGDNITALVDPSPPPSPGQTLTTTIPCGLCTLNVAARFVPPLQDAGVTTSAGPSGAAAGRPALLSSTVTNTGPGETPITFTDQVPSGLTINSAVAGDGTCSTSGQTVTCTISGLSSGASVPVDVVVTPNGAGSYANSASVAVGSPFTDPVAANNSASATLAVGPPAPNPTCVVPKLKNTPSSVAKAVLTDLGCAVKVKHKHSSVRKGLVIGTSPGPGTYPFQQTVTLKVSSGKKH
jgi:hypothetical protein